MEPPITLARLMSTFGAGAPNVRLRRRLMLVLVGWALVGSLLAVVTLQLHLSTDPLSDVHAYYDAGARLDVGVPLYDQPANTNDAEFYRYPPLLAIAFRPLAMLPFGMAALIWEAIVVATFLATIWQLGVRRETTWLIVGILGLPIGWSLAIGQAQVPVTLLMTIGSPFAIALAGELKILPAFVAVYWLGRRDWHRLALFAGWTVALAALQVLVEPRGSLAFLGTIGLGQVGDVANLSPYVASPILWLALAAVGFGLAWRLAPTRWGWAAAVTFSVFVTPRLLVYMVMSLVAGARTVDPRRGAAVGSPGIPKGEVIE